MRTIFLIAMLSFVSCDDGPKVKIYRSDVERGGLYRAQQNELVPYSSSNGYYCMNEDDFEAMMAWCTNPRSMRDSGLLK